jgi:hypothetical protein
MNKEIITRLITRLIIILGMFSIITATYVSGECTPACMTVEDCYDLNPIIIRSCESAGTCEARCKYVIPNNITQDKKDIVENTEVSGSSVNIKETINKVTDEKNEISLIGTMNINKGITKKHFLFVLQDSKQLIIPNLDRVIFNVDPYKITNDSIMFLLEKNSPVHLITYYIEPETTKKLLENSNFETQGFTKQSKVREPTPKESIKLQLDLMDTLTPKMLKIIKVLGAFILISLLIIISYIYYRKQERVEIKPLK